MPHADFTAVPADRTQRRVDAPLAAHRISGLVLSAVVAAMALSYVLLGAGRRDYPNLHLILDTGVFLQSAVLALLLWDIGERVESALARFLSFAFGVAALLHLIHVLVSVEWFGALASLAGMAETLRPSTWPPAIYMMPLGLLGAVVLSRHHKPLARRHGLALLTDGVALQALFLWIPRYATPQLLGITRPFLIGVPIAWLIVGVLAWRWRREDRLYPILARVTPIFALGNASILWSTSPHDTQAMISHVLLIGGLLALLISLMQLAGADMRDRIRIDRELAEVNRDLERRVVARTSELEAVSRRVTAQVEHLDLLHRVTRAIGEREDFASILHVVVTSLEEQLSTEFSAVCVHDVHTDTLTVSCVGPRSANEAAALSLGEGTRLEIDDGLARCLRGELVYERDITRIDVPFTTRLVSGGLRAVVMAPLRAATGVFGILVAARREVDGFTSGEREFLRQLSEHAALAAHHAQLHAALQAAYDDLRATQHAVLQQERLRALGQMASGVAHDINNAITPVALYTESLLETERSLSEYGRQDLEIIRRAIDDVAETVTRLGEFYRPREKQSRFVPVALNPLVDHVLDLTRARWSDMPQQRGAVIVVRRELASDLPSVMGAESEIREALTNLVLNAVDAMPAGGELTLRTRTRTLRTRAPVHLGHVELEVVDTGVGMDDETRRRCLEPFFTTKGDRGSGLGLAAVYGVVQRHGADIDVESTPGAGTTFRISFPLASVTTSDAPVATEPTPVPHMRVLIVDDDEIIRRALREILEADGHTVASASDGSAAIAMFNASLAGTERYALVITDLGMPHVDGRHVAHAVKSASPMTPVILLTGWGQQLLAEDNAPDEVDRVLAKPPKLRELREALAYCAALVGV